MEVNNMKENFDRQPSEKNIDEAGNLKLSAPFYKFQDIKMKMVIPKGELFSSTMNFLTEIGVELPEVPDRRFEMPASNLPLVIVPIRAMDIPKAVFSLELTDTKAGITGSDIIWEKSYELGYDKNEGEEIPLEKFVSDPPQSTLYAGLSEEYADYIIDRNERDPNIQDLSGQTIVTIFPKITQEYIEVNKLDNTQIYEVSGQDEAFQYLGLRGILGIKSSGRTIEANGIYVVDEFFKVAVKLLTFGTDKMTTRDLQILNDLREMTYLALKKRGML